MTTLTFTFRLAGTLVDADRVVFADPTGSFGFKDLTTGEILLPAGRAWLRSSLGSYLASLADLPIYSNRSYEFWVAVTYDHETTYVRRVVTGLGSPEPPPVLPPATIAAEDCQSSCPATYCERASQAFVRLRTRPTLRHGTSVEWLLHPQFRDPPPYRFQLQVGETGSHLADDWQDVGLPADNAGYLVDTEPRTFGKTQRTHYRVVLTTPLGTYLSPPAATWGDVSNQYWRMILAREREWRLQLEKTQRGQEGYLLKRRWAGEPPAAETDILDPQTDEIVRPQAPLTRGTEFVDGYYAPIPCVFAELDFQSRRDHNDNTRGPVDDELRGTATLLARPQVDSLDVWVNARNDFRWLLHGIRHLEDINDIPIVVQAEARLLPFSHVIYTIPVP
jgi:hypothetical protein